MMDMCRLLARLVALMNSSRIRGAKMKNNNHMTRPFVVNRGKVVRAVYRKPEIADHEGNPLEEALPPMLTTDQLILRLQHYPEYSDSMRRASDEFRYLAIQNSMRFFVPL